MTRSDHMGSIRWAHFSDLHFKYTNYDTKDMRKKLETYIERCGHFDYVVITGDICHQGKYDRETVDFVKNLIRLTECSLENVIITPGNHDATRSRVRKTNLDDVIKLYREKEGNLTIPNDYRSVLITDPFATYNNLYTEIKETAPPQMLHYIDKRDKINFIILNTAVFSGQTYPNQSGITKEEENKEDQNLFICDDKEFSALTNDNNLNILNVVVAHHAVECFNDSEREKLTDRLEELNVDLYLCGHVHKALLKTITGRYWPLQVSCGGLFKDGNNAPNFVTGEFNTDDDTVILTIHAYIRKKWVVFNAAPKPYHANGVYTHRPIRLIEKHLEQNTEMVTIAYPVDKPNLHILPVILTKNAAESAFPVNNLPDQNTYFTGRDDALEQISRDFQHTSKLVVFGGGGFGKSQLAREYAHRHKTEYDYIYVMNAEGESSLRKDYCDFALRTGFPSAREAPFDTVLDYVKLWLERNKRFLFIYENAEGLSDKVLAGFLPVCSDLGGHILINTRDCDTQLSNVRINIEKFPFDGVTFLQKRLENKRKIDMVDAQELSRMMKNFPLAMECAAAYIERTESSCADYINLFKNHKFQNRMDKIVLSQYEKALAAAWDISIEKIKSEKDTEGVLQLFNLCAYFAPENIPLSMFVKKRDKLPLPLRNILNQDDEDYHILHINMLKRYSLISWEKSDGCVLLSMHRHIQANVQHKLAEKKDTQWLSYCLDVLHAAFKYDYGDKQSMDTFRQNAPHVREITGHAKTLFKGNKDLQEKVAWLQNEVGCGFCGGGQYDEALKQFKDAWNLFEEVSGKECHDITTVHNNIAGVYLNQEKYDVALKKFKTVFANRKKVLCENHPDLAVTHNGIALAYFAQGKYDEALEEFKKASIIWDVLDKEQNDKGAVYEGNIEVGSEQSKKYYTSLDEYQIDSAITHNGIALVYSDQAKYDKALQEYHKTLDTWEKVLSKDHLDIATAYNGIAIVHSRKGAHKDALVWYKKARVIREKVLGKEHPYTAITYTGIGLVHSDMGKYSSALKLFKKTLDIYGKVLGTKQLEAATTYNGIAGVYFDQGKYAKAMKYYEKDIDITSEILGENHPDIVGPYNGKASVYSDRGQYEDALVWYKKARVIREKIGTDHPDTATTYNGIAVVHFRQGHREEALVWYKKALDIREKVLGKEHPDTASTYNGIAGVYFAQGEDEKALVWYKKALDIDVKLLGPNHLNTKIVKNNIEFVNKHNRICDD